jgi:hypothetical protein
MPPPPPPPSAVRRFFTRVKPALIFGQGAVQLPPSPTTASTEKKRAGLTLRWSTVAMLMMLFFILIAHALTHGLAARRPRLFAHHSPQVSAAVVAAHQSPTVVHGTPAGSGVSSGFGKIFDLEWIFTGEEVEERDFVVETLGPIARR